MMEGTPNGDDDSSHTPTRANEGMNDSDQTLNTAGNEEVRERNQDNDEIGRASCRERVFLSV